MNFLYDQTLEPLRILMVNPLVPASQLTIIKMLSGAVFGMKQLIHMTLLVYSNEIPSAQEFIQEVIGCNLACLHTIVATSDLPSISDADIFCFMSNFANPNVLDFDNLDTDDHFDSFYLIIKIAYSLGKSAAIEELDAKRKDKKPIIITDGLIVLDILNTIGCDIKPSGYYCPSPIPALAKTLLSEHLKVQCNDINHVYVWGANDLDFHVEIEKPLVKYDEILTQTHCDWEMVSVKLLDPLKMDNTQFNASWMRREFIEKLTQVSTKNPYGCIYKAWEMCRNMINVWKPRAAPDKTHCISMGVISDGSLRTIKGLPYFFPMVSQGDKWEINERYEELPHVRQEIKRFNQIVKSNHKKLVKYCKKFLEENVINQAFVPADDETDSIYSSTEQSSQGIV
ncbi:uncharacterized protein LOC142976716 [Anticarsia gemmatalis]|uniref:uncharacterized protein LOC142976716 n=1 Tax=Anticarsia gemmatalis TaxID=129554 RepID=UPI003F75E50E